MSGILNFIRKYPDEQACLAALVALKWPTGFICSKCQHDKAYHLEARPRVYECAKCGHQNSITSGTVFHKTRTPIHKWFLAAYMIATDKRGCSAMRISKELELRYDTAWLMAHKIREALFERTGFELTDFIETDETFYGGYREKGARGRTKNDKKSLIVLAVEKRYVARKSDGKHHWIAGNARVEVIEKADMPTLTGFSNIKSWLNGTHHGVSKKHLPRYLREWNYRFNRRAGSTLDWVLARMATKPGIEYKTPVAR